MSIAKIVAICLLGVATIAWIVAEFACSRTFVGTLVSRETTITFSYDEERITIETDSDGMPYTSTSGDDETIAYKKYLLTFYSDGEMRTVTAGTAKGYAPYAHREDLALAALAANNVEPPIYTYAKLKTQYLVQVSGWLIDGTVRDITPLETIKAE